jgi:hypothetical protein
MREELYSDRNVHLQQRAARALIKFCEDHGDSGESLSELRACLKSLERGDMKSAVEHYLRVPLGGMGCFNDWLPPAVFSHETPEYVQAVFEALVSQWSLLMKLSVPVKEK